ncbi:MAG: anti-sigma factor [Burkholderiaceae bacterium]
MDTTNDLWRPDDELLSAWLDHELDETTTLRVRAWLQQHPEDAARVRLWAADRDALRSRLDAELDHPLPPVWRERVFAEPGGDLASPSAGGRPGAGWWAGAAVVALATALAGGAGGWWWARHDAPAGLAWQRPANGTASTTNTAGTAEPWPRFAALAHAVYVPERRHPVEVAVEGDAAAQRAQEAHLSGWLTKRLDVPVKMFDLRDQGFRLVGGRLLPEGNGPCAQLMYEDAAGQRVTVYLRRAGAGTPAASAPAAFRYESVQGLGLFYWVEGATGYALVGPLPRDRLLTLAEAIARQE